MDYCSGVFILVFFVKSGLLLRGFVVMFIVRDRCFVPGFSISVFLVLEWDIGVWVFVKFFYYAARPDFPKKTRTKSPRAKDPISYNKHDHKSPRQKPHLPQKNLMFFVVGFGVWFM